MALGVYKRNSGGLSQNLSNVRVVAPMVSRHIDFLAQLVEKQGSKLRFRLPVASMSIADAFALMQAHKEALQVEEYSLSQTTLEQIFNQFAAEQEEETGGAAGIVHAGVLGGAQPQPQVQPQVQPQAGASAAAVHVAPHAQQPQPQHAAAPLPDTSIDVGGAARSVNL